MSIKCDPPRNVMWLPLPLLVTALPEGDAPLEGGGERTRNEVPCTLHPAPCTLHPAPHTLHPAP